MGPKKRRTIEKDQVSIIIILFCISGHRDHNMKIPKSGSMKRTAGVGRACRISASFPGSTGLIKAIWAGLELFFLAPQSQEYSFDNSTAA